MILLGEGLSADGMMRSEVEKRRWDDVLGIYSAKRMFLKAGNIHSREAGIIHSRDAQIMVSVAACWQINTHSTLRDLTWVSTHCEKTGLLQFPWDSVDICILLWSGLMAKDAWASAVPHK